MYNLEQMITELETFQQQHKQLKSFFFGWLDDFEKNKSQAYPCLIATPSTVTLNEGEITDAIQVIVCDLLKDDLSNQKPVLSEMREIVKDFNTYLDQNSNLQYLIISKGVSANPFNARFNDNVAGYGFDLTLRQSFDWDVCKIPIN